MLYSELVGRPHNSGTEVGRGSGGNKPEMPKRWWGTELTVGAELTNTHNRRLGRK